MAFVAHNNAFLRVVCSAMRSVGQSMDKAGAKLEVAGVTEKLLPSLRNVAFKGATPKVNADVAFVASNATVIGDVTLGARTSVWYGAVLRGDVNTIKIGDGVSIGDHAVVHVAKIAGDSPAIIGDNVSVGANAIVHACTLEAGCVIGAGAQVLDKAVVQSNAVVAPGATVLPGAVVKSGELWAGSPAKLLRTLTAGEIDGIEAAAEETAALALTHAEENAKDWAQILEDKEDWEDKKARPDTYFRRMGKEEHQKFVAGHGTVHFNGAVPGRIFNSVLKKGSGEGIVSDPTVKPGHEWPKEKSS